MAPVGGDEPRTTWLAHPDPEVEEMFLQANRDGYVIFRLGNVYTLVSPDNEKQMQFLGRVVASSGIWRHLVNELRDWLEQTKDEPKGKG
jgi:hypothetical protein